MPDSAEAKDQYAAYLPGIRRRWRAEQSSWHTRRTSALQVAREAAVALREQFAVEQVIAFGSVVRDGRFDERSDVDLAVVGLAREDYLKAWSVIDQHPDFQIDLVDLADCPPSLQAKIREEGLVL